jgi:hypothetical protein
VGCSTPIALHKKPPKLNEIDLNLRLCLRVWRGRGEEGFGGREIKRKLEKSFTFFEKVFFIENDK